LIDAAPAASGAASVSGERLPCLSNEYATHLATQRKLQPYPREPGCVPARLLAAFRINLATGIPDVAAQLAALLGRKARRPLRFTAPGRAALSVRLLLTLCAILVGERASRLSALLARAIITRSGEYRR